ncbi:MAG: bifunctional phosphoribosylaminoimidazolecarboxamide formyltransferase/IMP cyclohydrolase, partial [Magnetospirillum sp.]|nr:bifunctional phosphoribosylaminoimidazolecarboxamide formyltransferase/IMP cyclohydrolase [Magnetospirillum sp.]
MSDLRPIRRALISVSDKTGLIEFARFLTERNVEILSTGGSAKTIRDAGIAVTEVADYTGFPEMLDGRVKTLHPKVHGGLLGIRDNAEHQAAMAEHGIAPIDLLVVNLYPFEATVAKGAGYDECVENIDIGGPAMIRAASKNHDGVTVVVDVEDYGVVMEELSANQGATTLALRKRLAATAYARTGAYDAAISQWFAKQLGDTFPRRVVVAGELKQSLRYGENPHQQAAFYVTGHQRPGIATARQLQGKELSYNNLNDTDAAFELAAEFDAPTVAIIKHANPCGVATGTDMISAYKAALATDPVSAFGGIIAMNRKLDGATAEEICKLFTEVVIAPEADEAAVAAFAAKKN